MSQRCDSGEAVLRPGSWSRTAVALGVPAALLMEVTAGASGGDGLRWMWSVAGAALLVVLAVALQAWPLRALTQTLKQRRPGDLADLPAPAQPELAPCVAALNELLAEQRRRQTQEQRLLAEASHQLRTPLAVLRTQLQEAGEAGPRLSAMLQTVDRASAVADELLGRLKFQQRERDLQSTAHKGPREALMRLDEAARQVALELAPLIARRRQDFALEASPSRVSADAWMLGELVRNLLANAVRHTPEQGSLGIVVRELAQHTELVVWDSGGGIAQADLQRVFEPFVAAAGGSGVGLGLSICQQLAQSTGADIQLFNRPADEQGKPAGLDAVVRWPHALTRVPTD